MTFVTVVMVMVFVCLSLTENGLRRQRRHLRGDPGLRQQGAAQGNNAVIIFVPAVFKPFHLQQSDIFKSKTMAS